MANQPQNDPARVATFDVVRFAYVQVFDAVQNKDRPEAKPTYRICLIIPKTAARTINAINQAVQYAFNQGVADKTLPANLPPGSWKHPLRDGDIYRADKPEFKNCMFINLSSVFQPGMVDENNQQILDPKQMYSGCYGLASFTCRAFNNKGNLGVNAQMNNLKKVRDGERLAGTGIKAEDEFSGIVTTDYEMTGQAYAPQQAAPQYPQQGQFVPPQQTQMYPPQTQQYPPQQQGFYNPPAAQPAPWE